MTTEDDAILKEVQSNYNKWMNLPESDNEPHKFIGDMATKKAISLTRQAERKRIFEMGDKKFISELYGDDKIVNELYDIVVKMWEELKSKISEVEK